MAFSIEEPSPPLSHTAGFACTLANRPTARASVRSVRAMCALHLTRHKISDRWRKRALLHFILHDSSFSLAAQRPTVRCIAWLDDLVTAEGDHPCANTRYSSGSSCKAPPPRLRAPRP